jgi:hypothetical protein
MTFLGANRLRIVEYFDELKAKVDVCVETLIAVNHQNSQQETRINQARADWFAEIDESEKFDLAELENRKDKNTKLENEELFKKFMFEFTVTMGGDLTDLRIISINTYITPGQIECFQVVMNIFNRCTSLDDLRWKSFLRLFLNIAIETDVKN